MNPKKNQVSLEDLLRIKRAERPPAQFWAEFERELRVKQLAAIVEPRPWWAPLIRVGARLSHHQLPVGAAAILVLSFVTVQEYRTPGFDPAHAPRLAAPVTYSSLPADEAIERESSSLAVAETESVQLTSPELAEFAEVAAAAMAVGQTSHAVQLEAAPVAVEPTPSARYIAANLAAAQADNPRLMDDVFGASMTRTTVRPPVRDPLAQVVVPGESRRSRLLATSLPPIGGEVDVAVGDSGRVARRLTEERLYDTISRIGVKGDRVAFKF